MAKPKLKPKPKPNPKPKRKRLTVRRLTKREKLRRQRISQSLKRYWKGVGKKRRKKIGKKISASLKATHATGVSTKVRKATGKASAYRKPVKIPTGTTKPPSVPAVAKPPPLPSVSSGLPAGYKPKNKAESVLQAMGDIFDAIRASLSSYNWSTIIHPNSDGTIDGELRLIGLPRGTSANDILLEVEGQIPKNIPGAWFSVGMRSPFSSPDDEAYSWGVHYRGALQTQAYPQRMTDSNVAENFATARKKIAGGLAKKGYRKPDELFIRIHWNPTGAHPPREK